MENASSRPGITPTTNLNTRMPRMPMGNRGYNPYGPPPPPYAYAYPPPYGHSGGSMFSGVTGEIAKVVALILLLLLGVYLFFQTDVGQGILEAASWLIPLVEFAGIVTGGKYAYEYGARKGFFGDARKATQLEKDAKAARKAGDLEKAEQLEKEAKQTKTELEEAGKAAEELKTAGRVGEEAKGGKGLLEGAFDLAKGFRL